MGGGPFQQRNGCGCWRIKKHERSTEAQGFWQFIQIESGAISRMVSNLVTGRRRLEVTLYEVTECQCLWEQTTTLSSSSGRLQDENVTQLSTKGSTLIELALIIPPAQSLSRTNL